MGETRPDRDLMVALRDRHDLGAFDELVRRWDTRLVSFFAKRVGESDRACDLRQETFIRVWRSAHTYKAEYAFSTWVMRIATNLARSDWRSGGNGHGRVRDGNEVVSLESEEPPASDVLAQRENAITMNQAMQTLSSTDQELVLLRFQMEMTYAEIAQVIGAPESTLKSRMSAILCRLRKQLEMNGLHKEDVAR